MVRVILWRREIPILMRVSRRRQIHVRRAIQIHVRLRNQIHVNPRKLEPALKIT
jgi:hypothetical protein